MKRLFFALRSGLIAFFAVALIVVIFSYVECFLKAIPYKLGIALHGGVEGGAVIGGAIAILELIMKPRSNS
ncbi:hypothetical protein DWU98_16135 [Dyella monticola]|uniref:Uncharacterized protein n=1 Tax=Dyella monticola TaxID=1927958 RepID=A0A370WVA5_9GAMM|nr:hypothetical protein DWU98_16135 [Dyella monticola]